MSEAVKVKRENRKRKKTFMTNAKKYGKRGYYGRGAKLSQETYDYLISMMEVFNKGFDNEDEKVLFAGRVFEEIQTQEVTCSCNQFGCRVVESLLPLASDNVIKQFIEAFSEELRPLIADRFASHVLEILLAECVKRSLAGDNESKEAFSAFVLKLSKFMLNNMEDYMWETYGNHTMRAVFHSICGIDKKDDRKQYAKEKKSEAKPEQEPLPISDDHKEIIEEYAQRLLSWPQLNDMPYEALTSGFLQSMLKSLHKVKSKLLNTYIKQFLDGCFAIKKGTDGETDGQDTPPIFSSEPSIMLLETVLQIAPAKRFTKIYEQCFKNVLFKLSIGKHTNFAVQRLFNHVPDNELFEQMFDELHENFRPILDAGHSGVILALGQTCKRLEAKQGLFLQDLMKAFDCLEPAERQEKFFIQCLCKFQPFDSLPKGEIDYEKEKLNINGTLLLQLMLEFKKPIKLVNGILTMDKYQLFGILSNPMGSHITDSFVKSQYVGEKSRERLIKVLQGFYQDLASKKFGSRTFDALWTAASMRMRLNIMEELAHKDNAWANGEFGKIIAYKINLRLYKANKEQWKTECDKPQKSKNLLQDVLGS